MKLQWSSLRKYLLIVGVALITIGLFLHSYDYLTVNLHVRTEPVLFPSRDGLAITGILYYPVNYNASSQYPTIVTVHGINANAMSIMTRMSAELARRNFLVLAINLRSHWLSAGICTLSAKEPYDVMGAIDWLFLRPDVNQSAIGLVGHSLGGMTVVRTAAQDPRVNATVQSGAPLRIIDIILPYVSNLNFQLFQLFLKLHNDLSDPTTLANTAPIDVVNITHPRNFLICYGDQDYAATLEEQLEWLYRATGNSSALKDTMYGNFTIGNASMLNIYPNVDHGGEPFHPPLIIDTIYWLENSLLGGIQGPLLETDLIQWIRLPFGNELLIIGFILTIPPVFSYALEFYEKKRKSKAKPEKDENALTASKRGLKGILSPSLWTAGIFALTALPVIPLIFLFPNLNTYRIAGLIQNLFMIHALFLGAALLLILILEKKVFNSNHFNFEIDTNRSSLFYSTIIGLILAVFLIFGLIALPMIPGPSLLLPTHPIDITLLIVLLTVSLMISEIYLRGFLFNNLYKPGSSITNWLQFLGIGAIGGFIQGISLSIFLLPFSFSFLTIGPLTLSFVIVGMVGGTAIFTLVGMMNNYLYSRTKSVIPGALILAFMLTFVFVFRFVIM